MPIKVSGAAIVSGDFFLHNMLGYTELNVDTTKKSPGERNKSAIHCKRIHNCKQCNSMTALVGISNILVKQFVS